jgi:hypothetical protein
LHDRFRIEEQKSAVAAAIAAGDPKLTLTTRRQIDRSG